MTETEKRGLGTFDKVLIGCGIGCGVLFLTVLFGGTFGTLWLFSTPEQAATDAIVGADSLAVVRLHELADDPGTQALLDKLLERLDEVNRQQQEENLPPSMRWLSDLQSQQRSTAKDMNPIIPREMTIVFERDPGDEDTPRFVVAANPRMMVRLFKTTLGLVGRLGDGEQISSEYRGHEVYHFGGDEGALAFVRGTVLFSDSRAVLETAIDRLETPAAGPHLLGDGVVPEGDWDLEGSLGSEPGFVEGFLDGWLALADGEPTPEEAVDGEPEALRLGFGFDVATVDEVVGQAVLVCPDAASASRWATRWSEGLEESVETLAGDGLELGYEVATEGERVVVDLEIVGLAAAIDTMDFGG